MEKGKYSKENALIVVAIDFGTTYSGWAYSVRKEYKDNHTNIRTKGGWKTRDGQATDKTPTVVLFTPDEKFHSFGYEAESKYAELVDDDEATGWKYFKRFKMALFNDETNQSGKQHRKATRKISKQQKLTDINGGKLSSLMVVSECLKYLKDDFLKTVEEKVNFVEMNDIHWVVTVPAIWSDHAKQFMRLAANQAGIDDGLLSLAYEPEAAAIYCKDIMVQKKQDGEDTVMTSFDIEESFLVLDCGGGTVDITAYKMQEGNTLVELFPPTGGPWGGTEVDKQFQILVEEIFGEDVWRGFEKSFAHDCLEFMRRFEGRKKNIGENDDDKVRILFPRELFDEYKSKTGVEFQSAIGVKKVRDKLNFPIQTMKDLFMNPVNATADHVKELLGKSELNGLKTILMVGGFSDSALLYEKIKSSFPSLNVLRPHEAVLSVVKGAVIYGHTPEIIPERVCARTYGIACNIPFDPMKHPQRCLGYYNGRAMCTDSFQTIVKKGETILLGNKYFERTFLPTHGSDTEATIDIYVSSDYNPLYTFGNNVTRLGSLFLRIPETQKGKNRPINVRISFQGTEIVVTAVEEGTNNIVSVKFDSL